MINVPTPPKFKFPATKPDGSATVLELNALDILSAAVIIIGLGKAIDMTKDDKPWCRLAVLSEQPDKPKSRIITPGN